MIRYKENIRDSKIYLKEELKFLSGLFILPLAAIIISIVILLYDAFFDKDSLKYFYIYVLLIIFFLSGMIKTFLAIRKMVNDHFEVVNKDGDIEYSLYKDGNEFVIVNITRKTVGRILIEDIQRVSVFKDAVFIKSDTDGVIFFPRVKE